MKGIFYQAQDEITGRYVVIDEEENSIWAYLTKPFNEQIDKNCFLGSRVKIEIEEFDFKEIRRKQIPPPMIKEFSTIESYQEGLRESDISVTWGINGNVIIKINRTPFLFFTEDEEKGFCRSISKNGIYGNQWNENKYKEKFK